jgi:hypothetical protein
MLLAAAAFAAATFSPLAALGQTRIGYEPNDLAPSASTPIVFVDALKQSAPWSSASPLSKDVNGNILMLAPHQTAERLVYAPGQPRPAGDYTMLYAGVGSFDVEGASVVARAAGRMVVRVGADVDRDLRLRLSRVYPRDPARDVRLILPGFERTYAAQPFYPQYVRSLAGYDALRFVRWSHAATLATSQIWPFRPHVALATQAAADGAAPEYEIALANATGADPWFSLPVGATDAYVFGFADLAHRFLDPRLHPTFEYGDRVWDSRTAVNAYARMAARNFRLPGDPSTGALEWYALRSKQVFAIVDRAFGPDAPRVSHALAIPGAESPAFATIDRTILSYASAARDASALVVESESPDAAFQSLDLSRAFGGPTTMWRRVGDRWEGTASDERRRIEPANHITFQSGSDSAPIPGHRAPKRTWPAMHMLSSREADLTPGRGPGLRGAFGDPLENVDLTSEGMADWVVPGIAGFSDRKSSGGNQIAVETIGVRPAGGLRDGVSFGWRDGTIRASGSARMLANADGFRITAPADATARVLRVYVSAYSSRVALRAQLGKMSYADASLASSREPRVGVYTLVYRAGAPSRIEITVALTPRRTPNGSVSVRAATLAPFGAFGATVPEDETTYHNDQSRTGWLASETQLTPSNVASHNFGLLGTLAVDGDVLAQPLYLYQYPMPGGGRRNLLIVATEHNSIYEFDADTGSRLKRISLGPSQSSTDVGCVDISPEYGITSTPVIDRRNDTMYVVAATEPSPGVFHTTLHALRIGTLKDRVPPVEITASIIISNGSKISFDPQNQMNRSSLAFANGTLYMGIGSHCDNNAGAITGWVLSYDKSLKQIGKFATTEDSTNYFLSSVWMTGYAPAFDRSGNVYIITGNGSFDANQEGKNYGETVLKLCPSLTTVVDYFTPANWLDLNNGDLDFGSGGIMLLPLQHSKTTHVAVAMGKFSTLYLLNADKLGKLHPNDAGALQSIPGTGGGVWGGPAFYGGPAGSFVYYQAGGAPLLAYSVRSDPAGVTRLKLSSTGPSNSGYGGSSPVVSSNGQLPGTAVVWLVNRSTPLQLEAYDASDVSHLLFQGNAGVWRNPQQNGFVTALVANGKVYVPATGTVTVFGLGHIVKPSTFSVPSGVSPAQRQLHGTIVRVAINTLTLRLRDGRLKSIDISAARSARHVGVLPVGHAVVVYGYRDRKGVFRAASVGHTSPNPADWPKDQ